jgi:hypothetical protein
MGLLVICLTANYVNDKYIIRTIEECIADIGFLGSTVFNSFYFKDGFYEMPLE